MIKLTATERGFYLGCLVRPGETFEFDDSRYRLPKWAVPSATYTPPEPKPFDPKPWLTGEAVRQRAQRLRDEGFDTRPVDAQLASAAKTGVGPSDPVEMRA